MKFTTTLILFIIAATVFWYVWYVDRDKPSYEQRQLVERRVFPTFSPPQITHIAATVSEREDMTGAIVRTESVDIQRDVEGWNVVHPVSFPADTPTIRQILDSVSKLDRTGRIDGDDYAELDKEAAGLIDPDIIATFSTPATSFTFNVGLTDPIGWDVYLQPHGADHAYLVPFHFKELMTIKLDDGENDIRRRAVFDVSRFRINSLIIEQPDATIELRRDDDLMWRLTSPVHDYADIELIAELLDKAENLRVSSFVDTATDVGTRRLALTVVTGTTSQRLIVGDEDPHDFYTRYLARRSEYQQHVAIPARDLEPFMLPPDDYRAREFVIFNQFEEPIALTQTVDDDSITFAIDGNAWTIRDMESPLVDIVQVEDYLYAWQDLMVDYFVTEEEARPALETPWIQLSFALHDIDTPREFILSAPHNGRVYAERSPGVFVAFYQATIEDVLRTDPFEFLDNEILSVPGEALNELRYIINDSAVTFSQTSNQWVVMADNAAVDFAYDVGAIISDAMPIMVERYVARDGDRSRQETGLMPPRGSLSFVGGRHTATLLLGNETEAGERYALLEDEPFIFLLPRYALHPFDDLANLARTAIEQAAAHQEDEP